MERDEAIAKLKRHEAELRQLGVEHLYPLARPRGARHAQIPMSICSLTIRRALSGFAR
jgi:hypothetical protein